MSRGDLKEAEWRLLKDLLPAVRGQRSRPAFDNRTIVNGILWRIRTGAPWRDVPEKYGKWMTVYQRFRRWSEAGVWEAVASALAQAMADNSRHSIDPTTVRGHVSAAGAKGTREQAFGRSRGGFTCKIHCLSDARGVPLVFHLTGGEAADCTAFEAVTALAEQRPTYLLADKGYDTDAIRNALREEGIRAVIPPRSHLTSVIRWNRRIYRERNRIERMIGHLKINRAIATHYDKLARSFLDVLHLATIRKCLRLATL